MQEQKKAYEKPVHTQKNEYVPTADYYKDAYSQFNIPFFPSSDAEQTRMQAYQTEEMNKNWEQLTTKGKFVCALIMKHASRSEFIEICSQYKINFQELKNLSYAHEVVRAVLNHIRSLGENPALQQIVQAIPEVNNPKPVPEQIAISQNDWQEQYAARHCLDELYDAELHETIADLAFYLGIDPKVFERHPARLGIQSLKELVSYVRRHQMAQGQPTLMDILTATTALKNGHTPEFTNPLVQKRTELLNTLSVEEINAVIDQLRSDSTIAEAFRQYGLYHYHSADAKTAPSVLRNCLLALQSSNRAADLDTVVEKITANK